ncbi:TPA: nucleotidyltransferase family protein, partial [Streptococcus pneumoniae]|nr:nucleotidyltransferase family protein [Streptococcus pneumoniae]
MRKQIISLFHAYLNENTQDWVEIDENFLLYQHLDMFYYYLCKKNNIEPPLMEKFEVRKKVIESRNRQYIKVARDLNAIFEKQSIQVAFLKGIQTSEKYYEEPWIRYYSDLDILVAREMIPGVEKLFYQLGYVFGHLKDNGEIHHATREEILYQKLFTHEIYNLVKKENDNVFINVDINFLFSWKGLSDSEI